jgi:hypothetical protein
MRPLLVPDKLMRDAIAVPSDAMIASPGALGAQITAICWRVFHVPGQIFQLQNPGLALAGLLALSVVFARSTGNQPAIRGWPCPGWS